MKNYEINAGTLAVISTKDGNARVIEDNSNYFVSKSAFQILDHSCKFFGSSYKGRSDGAKEIIGYSYKVPIVVEDTQNLIFFPTTSPYEDDCMWLAVHKIKSYKSEKFNRTTVVFINGKKVLVPLSYRAVQNQILRATRLSYLLENHRDSNIKF